MLEPKQLTCMDEELSIEIVKPKDTAQDLIITVSLTRTYLTTSSLEIIKKERDQTCEMR